MPSYRFCRSDDVPLLVEAYNDCYRPHFPGLPPLTAEALKRAVRDINVWTSSCMVATSGAEPIAVLLAAKREAETLIHAVGVKPGHQRRGHGRHLLASLSAKLAILGPPRLVAEVPEDRSGACAFMEVAGYRREREYTDFVAAPAAAEGTPSDVVIPVTFDDLVANDALDLDAARAWERAPATLIKKKDRLAGLAVASAERIEAYLLYEEVPGRGERTVLAFGGAGGPRRDIWLGLLFRHCGGPGARRLRISRVHRGEASYERLRSWGFEPAGVTIGYAAEAVPG